MGKQQFDHSKYELKLDPSQEKKFQDWFEQSRIGKIYLCIKNERR